MNKKTKELVRVFIIEKIRDTTYLELNDLAHAHGIDDYFSVAECFDNEAYRVEKFFCFPELPGSPEEAVRNKILTAEADRAERGDAEA